MKGYLNPSLLPSETQPHIDMMTYTGSGIVAEGPARTAKTIRNLRKLFALHAKHKGLRSCIVRTNSVDLNDTIRWDIINTVLRYPFSDPMSQIKQQGGERFFHHLYLNEGDMKLGGMNRPGSILGGKYDVIMLSELSQFTEEQFQMLKTRCTGDSAKWRLNDGTIVSQMLGDTNPDRPDHWMYQYEDDGLLKFVKFDFIDNPYYFRKNRWSRVGKTSVDELDKTLVGIYHDRYFKGLRKAPEDQVFEIKDIHLIHSLPNLNECMIYRGMDFGIQAPNVCLWFAIKRDTRDIIVFQDYRKIGQDIIEFGNDAKTYTSLPVIDTVIDNDENRKMLLLKHCQMPSTMAEKGAGSIMNGVQLIRMALRNAVEGLPGGLYFYTDMKLGSCPEIHRRKLPKTVTDEMRAYQMSPKKDEPIKSGVEHGIDVIRYFMDYLQRSRMLGFATGSATRQTRI